jgi:lipoprotein-anchoring transpeptidase ErfK/SrfK
VAGCNGGGTLHSAAAGTAPEKAGATTKPTVSAATIKILPATGAHDVRPDTKVKVAVSRGTLTQVTVKGEDGSQVNGSMDLPSTTWTATDSLGPGAAYTVTASAADAHGLITTTTTLFRTLEVSDDDRLRAVNVAPLNGSTVGVGQPISVGFNHVVKDRAAVQQALQVEAMPPVEGAWYWIDEETVDYRPESFWPAGTKVTLHAKLQGVNAGNGRWGSANRDVSFTIGRQQIIKVDVDDLQMKVVRNGKTVKTFQVTSGKPGWETRNGIKVIQDKETDKTWTNEAINAPEQYRLHSDWALRMTQSGEFLHDAPWSIGNLGRVSASHGCVGMYPSNAHWLFENTIVGDPVIVTGSPRPYEDLGNLFADWNVAWPKWSAGNAHAS